MKLHPLQDEILDDFTIDFSYEFSDVTSRAHFLSYATSKHNNELAIGQKRGMLADQHIYDAALFPLDIETAHSVTIVRVNDEISIYADGELLETSIMTDTIGTGGVWIIGQEQDGINGQNTEEEWFEAQERFIGKICDFQMWNYGLDEESLEILFLNDGSMETGNVFDSPPSYTFEKINGAISYGI